MKLFPAIALLLVASFAFAQQPTPLNNLDDLAGLSVNQAAKLPETKLEVVGNAVHLSSVSPQDAAGNSYLSLVITTPAVDMNKQALNFEAWTTDPAKTRALYVRGYDAQGQPALSWMSWAGPLRAEKQTFEVIPGLTAGPLAWEPGYLKTQDRSAIVKWEIYVGTPTPGTAFDLFIDNLRTVPSELKSFMDTKEAHKLYPDTPLGGKGDAATVIYTPAEADWAALGTDLAAAIEKLTGNKPEVKPGERLTLAQAPASHTILIGNVVNNPAALYPYSHLMMFADGVFPGPGGYELRTVSDPWGNKRNLVILGATDLEGAKAGLAALTGLLTGSGAASPATGVTLQRTVQVKLGGDAARRFNGPFEQKLDEAWLKGQQNAAEDALKNGGHTGLFSQIAGVGTNYALTGRDEFATLYVWLTRRANEHYLTKPDTFGGPWGMDSDFPSQKVIPAWDAVEESPALTAADRLDVSRILFQYITDAAVPEASGAAGTAMGGRTVSNHGTFAAMGAFMAGEYFDKYYGSVEGKQWVKMGDDCFQNLSKNFKVHEDCNGYQWLTNSHIIRYAQTKPDLTFFENGNARRAADYAVITMNNLGYQVPYGDTGEWKCWFSELPVLRAAEWFYRDGRYQWAIDQKVKITGRVALQELDPGLPAKEPADLANSRAVALDPIWYNSDGGEKELPAERAFDKVAFRSSFDPQGAFLLLDGLSNGGHRHMDGNSVLQWTQNDRIWIADADYIKSLPKFHNGVLILKDGQSAAIPSFVQLEHFADLPSFAGSTTTYPDYAGATWRRHVLWIKDAGFMVVDQMTAREAGDYSFRAVWQTVGNVELKENGLDIEQGGQFARFATTADARCLVDDDPLTGKNWSSYPYAGKPIVRVFQSVFNRKLQAGQTVNIFTFLHASGEKASPVRLQRLGEQNVAINGLAEPMIVGVADAAGKIGGLPEAISKAAAIIFTPQRAFALGLTEADFMGQQRSYPQGADIEYDLTRGQIVALTPAGTSAAQEQKTERTDAGAIPASEARDGIRMLMATAAPVAPAGATALDLPALKSQWTYLDKLGSYLLTNNPDSFEAVDAGLKLAVSPAPLDQNVFAQDKGNTPDNLTDGVLASTDGAVMWDVDQPVTVDLALDNQYDLHRLTLKAFFATSSSKNKLFQLGRVQAQASNDGFKQDVRTLADFTDTETHGNWGAPGYGPQTYDFADLKANAKAVRLILTPRPGTAVYLCEVQLWGNRPGLEIDLTKKLRKGLPTHVFRTLKTADLNGDKLDEVIAGSSNGNVYCFTADGKLLWKSDCGGAVNSVNVVDFAGDGKLSVIAGCMEARMVAFDAAGKPLWTFDVPNYKRAGHVRTVFPADITGTGKQVAIAGAENWQYYAVDANGKQLWKYESVHGSTAGCAADMDGDKKQEIVAGTEYYWWHVINPDGSRRFGYNTKGGPCANAVAAGDLNGDGKEEALYGGADTNVHALDGDGKLLWMFNTGDEVQALQCADVNGDGKAEILVTSLSFNLYCLDGTGKVLWRHDLSNQVRALTTLVHQNKLVVAAGCDDGYVYLFSAADGKPSHRMKTNGEVLALTSGSLQAGSQSLIATTADGNLTVLALP